MSRISIDVTHEQHQRLEAMAALAGKSVEDFILECTVGRAGSNEPQSMAELEALIDERIAHADGGAVSRRTAADIRDHVRRDGERQAREA